MHVIPNHCACKSHRILKSYLFEFEWRIAFFFGGRAVKNCEFVSRERDLAFWHVRRVVTQVVIFSGGAVHSHRQTSLSKTVFDK